MGKEERIDHRRNLASVLLAIAQGINTRGEIAREVGLTERAISNLLGELQESHHIKSDKPRSIQDHNTKKVNYSLLDDPWNFSYYVTLIYDTWKERIKDFMQTDFYISAASKTCETISKGPGMSDLTGGFYIYKETKNGEVTTLEEARDFVLGLIFAPSGELERVNAALQEARSDLPKNMESIADLIKTSTVLLGLADKYAKMVKEGWKIMEDPLTSPGSPVFNIEMLRGLIYSRKDESVGETIDRLGSMKDVEIAHTVENLIRLKKTLPGAYENNFFDKAQRSVAISRAASNEGLFYEALFRLITTFPDSAYSLCKDISFMISSKRPVEPNYTSVDSFLESLSGGHTYAGSQYVSFETTIFWVGINQYYLSVGSIAHILLISALRALSNDNAIIPDLFLEEYVLGRMNKKRSV